MTLPGPVITDRDQAVPRTAPTDTGVWFVVGTAERGPIEPALIRSMQDYHNTFGARTDFSQLADSCEAFFKAGGTKAYVRRMVGTSPVAATVDLDDATSAVSLTLTFREYGDFADAYSAKVSTGTGAGSFYIEILDADGVVVEKSPDFASQDEAVAWESNLVTVTKGAATDIPATDGPAVNFASGDADLDTIDDDGRVAALADFSDDLGPGQVTILVPPDTGATAVIYTGVAQHAEVFNRVGFIDLADTATVATNTATAKLVRALGAPSKHVALFVGQGIMRGLTPSTTRKVPYSAVQAGLCARVDAAGNPNVPAAGENGIADFLLGITQEFKVAADREALNDAGIIVPKIVYGQVRTYGYRTAADPQTYPLHWMLNNVRLDMAIHAEAEGIAERFVFRLIDGDGHAASDYNAALVAMLADYYRIGALFGATSDDAFRVDTGDTVNTDETAAAGRLIAVISLKRSPMAERTEIEVVRVALTSAV